MTEQQLQDIKDRIKNSSPGKWFAEEGEYSWDLYHLQEGFMMPLKIIKAPKKSTEFAEYWPDPGDEDLIVNARQDMIVLVNEVERLQEEIRQLKSDK